ncbi:hypothetical protein KEM48_010684 [Puccinia striiformis f. sp. tritici PST-130]|nr:hypothetical protein KEM48_010684 [Puccinia striiformis f. sp. tritici PST-130]
MVSFAYLVTLLSVLVALSRAEEASSAKPEEVEDKFFFGNRFSNFNNFNYFNSFNTGSYLYSNYFNFYRTWSNTYNNIFGFGCFPQNSLGLRYFVKANEGAQSVSRRAISLDADQLVRRADTESVTCIAAKGVAQEFSVKDCVAASRQLAEKKTSSATVGQCTLSLVNDKEKISAASVSAHTLEKTTRQVLKSCTNSVSETNMRLIPSHLLAIIHLLGKGSELKRQADPQDRQQTSGLLISSKCSCNYSIWQLLNDMYVARLIASVSDYA